MQSQLGRQNPYNMIRATIDGLVKEASPRMVAQRRGKKVADILNKDIAPSASPKKRLTHRGLEHGEDYCCKTNRLSNPSPCKQRQTLIGLGLNKMHKTRELEDTPSVRGMVNKISHMVEIIEERD